MKFIKSLYFKPFHIDYMTTKEFLVCLFGFPFLIIYGIWKFYITKAWAYEMEIEECFDCKLKR